MRIQPTQDVEVEGNAQVLAEEKILERKEKIIPQEKKEEVKFQAHLFMDNSKQTYVEKIAPELAEKIPEKKRSLLANKSVDFLIGKYELGQFNETYVATVRDLTKQGMKAPEIVELVKHTYGNLPEEPLDKADKTRGPFEDQGTEKTDSDSKKDAFEATKISDEPSSLLSSDLDVKEALTKTLPDTRNVSLPGRDQLRDVGNDLGQLRNQMAIDRAQEITSRRQETTLSEVRELSEELARIRRELLLQKIDEVKEQMFKVLTAAANGAKHFSVAITEWVKEVAEHIGELSREAIENFKKKSSVAEYATLFKSVVNDPEKYRHGNKLYKEQYEMVERKLQEKSETTVKPPKLLVRLFANSLAYET